MPRSSTIVTAVVPCLLAAAALAGPAQDWTLTIDPAVSSATTETSVGADLEGFLIGDFDARANPGGTQTRPGFFGGSGNLPVDLSIGVGVDGGSSAELTGMFDVSVIGSDTISLSGVELDLLGGAPATLPLELDLLFGVFRTFDPDSLFPGGIPITLPFGDASLDALTATQVGPALGTLTPGSGAGEFVVAIMLPVVLEGQVSLLEQSIPLPPTPLALPLTGTLVLDGPDATLSFEVAVAVDETDEGPFEGVGFQDLPFELPTVLPPGDSAGILISADLQQVAFAQSVNLALTASGTMAPGVLGDVTGDGLVDFNDLLTVLANFGPCDACPEDVDGSGAVDFGDVLAVLANWTA